MGQTRILNRDEKVFGLPCRAGTAVDVFERSGTLARAVTYRGVELPAGSRFGTDCDFDSLWVRLAGPTRIHGHPFPAGSRVEFPPGPFAPVWLALLPLFPFYVYHAFRALADVWRRRVTVVLSAAIDIGDHHAEAGERAELSAGGRINVIGARATKSE